MTDTTTYELYFSTDVETDGPIPGTFSMVSLGTSLVGYQTSQGEVVKLDADDPANQFYREIKPISGTWDQEALAVSGLDRDYLIANGAEPRDAMNDFEAWVSGRVRDLGAKTAVFAAYPLGFDWLFTYWYLMSFADKGSPFSHGRHIDMKTLFAARSGNMITHSTKRYMPKFLMSTRKHTHNALDDAIEQGDMLYNLLLWDGKK